MKTLKEWAVLSFFLILVYLLLSHTTTEPILRTSGAIGVSTIKAFQGR